MTPGSVHDVLSIEENATIKRYACTMGAAGLTLCHKNGDLLPIQVKSRRIGKEKSHEHCEPGVNLQGKAVGYKPNFFFIFCSLT